MRRNFEQLCVNIIRFNLFTQKEIYVIYKFRIHINTIITKGFWRFFAPEKNIIF